MTKYTIWYKIRNRDLVWKEIFEQCRSYIFPKKCYLQNFLQEGCWELQSSLKHYCMSYDGTCGEGYYRNQACYYQKDKYQDGNLTCTLALLKKKENPKVFIFTPARDVPGQTMGFPAWIQRYVLGGKSRNKWVKSETLQKEKLFCNWNRFIGR